MICGLCMAELTDTVEITDGLCVECNAYVEEIDTVFIEDGIYDAV